MDYMQLLDMAGAGVFFYSICKSKVIYKNQKAIKMFNKDFEKTEDLYHPFDDIEFQLRLNQLKIMNIGEEIEFWLNRNVEQGRLTAFTITAKKMDLAGDIGILFTVVSSYAPVSDTKQFEITKMMNPQKIMMEVLDYSLHSSNADDTINYILQRVGKQLDVSRVYIFEFSRLHNTCNNTYEWCNEGITPQKANLQNVDLKDLDWIAPLRNEGRIVISDINMLEESVYEVLAPQDIKAVFVMPLMRSGVLHGFMGFDECRSQRQWSEFEGEVLEGIVSIVSALTFRGCVANVETTIEILKTVLDNMNSIIYVADVENHELLFTNKLLQETYGLGDMKGMKCWKALHNLENGPCSFCPNKYIFDENGKPLKPYRWETYNEQFGRWFSLVDAAILWIDGRYVHMEQAIDITKLKENEKLLETYAKTDIMTGTLKRDWGIQLLEELLMADERDINLVVGFLDMDSLKFINDNFGHSSGDLAIKTVVEILWDHLRPDDIICRMGGDEFLVIMDRCELHFAENVISQVKEALEQLNSQKIYKFPIRISAGLVDFKSVKKRNADEIIRLADSAMYADKRKKITLV